MTPRKSKVEILAQMQKTKEMKHQIELAKKIFPLVSDMKTIYDAQTVVQATAGFIKAGFEEYKKKEDSITVENVQKYTDEFIKDEKKSAIKTSIEKIFETLKDEPAEDVIMLLQTFGKSLSAYSANKFMKNPMSDIKMKDFIS